MLAAVVVATGAQRHHALQRGVRPETLALMDGQRSGVIDQKTPVLRESEREREREREREN